MYPGNPKSLPLCILNETKSNPNRFPAFLKRLFVTCIITVFNEIAVGILVSQQHLIKYSTS